MLSEARVSRFRCFREVALGEAGAKAGGQLGKDAGALKGADALPPGSRGGGRPPSLILHLKLDGPPDLPHGPRPLLTEGPSPPGKRNGPEQDERRAATSAPARSLAPRQGALRSRSPSATPAA